MLISITGRPGSGKTTLIKILLKELKNTTGFYTEEVRKNGKRTGFDIVASWGERNPLARVMEGCKWKVGRYCVFVEEVDRLVENLKVKLKDASVIYMDEIGKMELFSKKFEKFIETLNYNEKIFIITLPIKNFHPIIKNLKEKSDLMVDAWNFWDRKSEAVKLILKFLEIGKL